MPTSTSATAAGPVSGCGGRVVPAVAGHPDTRGHEPVLHQALVAKRQDVRPAQAGEAERGPQVGREQQVPLVERVQRDLPGTGVTPRTRGWR